VIGETNSGKSTLMGEGLLPWRRFLVVIRTKTDNFRRPIKYPVQTVTKTARTLENQRYDRVELRPKYEEQAREIWAAFNIIWKQGGWTCYNDEEWYLEEELGLTKAINKLLTQGSGKGISMVLGAQRPTRISRFVISQSTHVLCSNVEGRDRKELENATNQRMGAVCSTLSHHEFAWFYRHTKEVIVVKLDIKSGVLEWRQTPRLVKEEESIA
jgi:hypothetical protein